MTILVGLDHCSLNTRLANAARREELKAKLAAADAAPPLLHPEMAELSRLKVSTLAQALAGNPDRSD